jgi:anti-sigma factor RsiW
MSEHVAGLLGAYEDGELGGLEARRVEAHLAECAPCRAQLEELRALRALLQEGSAPLSPTPPDRFVAQVGLRLPPRPVQPSWRRALGVGWRLVPLGLLGTWAFGQTALLVAGIVLTALSLGLGGDAVVQWLPQFRGTWLALLSGMSDGGLGRVGSVVTHVLSGGWPLAWIVLLNLALLVAIGVPYWSWMASWWVRRQRQAGLS